MNNIKNVLFMMLSVNMYLSAGFLTPEQERIFSDFKDELKQEQEKYTPGFIKNIAQNPELKPCVAIMLEHKDDPNGPRISNLIKTIAFLFRYKFDDSDVWRMVETLKNKHENEYAFGCIVDFAKERPEILLWSIRKINKVFMHYNAKHIPQFEREIPANPNPLISARYLSNKVDEFMKKHSELNCPENIAYAVERIFGDSTHPDGPAAADIARIFIALEWDQEKIGIIFSDLRKEQKYPDKFDEIVEWITRKKDILICWNTHKFFNFFDRFCAKDISELDEKLAKALPKVA